MTLDGAIEHANQVADSYKDTAPACKCAHEHRQLADWLTELKVLRTENAEMRETLQRRTEQFEGMTEMWVGRGVENAKLRELVSIMSSEFSEMSKCSETPCAECPVKSYCDYEDQLMRELGMMVDNGGKP